MKKPILIAIVAVIIIVIAAAGIVYSGVLNPTDTNPTPTPEPETPVQETVRDATMTYIAANHEDMASMTVDLTWAGGRQETGLVGSDTYIYTAGNWNVTITNPVVMDPVYTISAVYTDTANAVTIEWMGTYENEAITETSFEYVVPE
ncbi:hypothetical protein GX563_03020 [Candidatus Bathyarchaeota archaeon]|nr:hypothetical protein [Candidatus Bathyarchaeota archaeon]